MSISPEFFARVSKDRPTDRPTDRPDQVTAIRIDVSRNRIIRTNLHLTMASVSLAGMTAVAGFLGMNLELPVWLDAGFTSAEKSSLGGLPFLATTAASVALGGGICEFALT